MTKKIRRRELTAREQVVGEYEQLDLPASWTTPAVDLAQRWAEFEPEEWLRHWGKISDTVDRVNLMAPHVLHEYQRALYERFHDSQRRFFSIGRLEVPQIIAQMLFERPSTLMESTANGMMWTSASPDHVDSGTILTWEALARAAESIRYVPIRQPVTRWAGAEAQFQPLALKPQPDIRDMAMQHLGYKVDELLEMDAPSTANRIKTQLIQMQGHADWRRTAPLNQELVKSAVLQMYKHLDPLRIIFVKGPTELTLTLRKSMPSRMKRYVQRFFFRYSVWNQLRASAALAEIVSDDNDAQYSWSKPDEPIATFCHAWQFVVDRVRWSQEPRTLLIMDYPRVIKLDNQERAHCEDGPAVSYADGSHFYAWHGIKLSARHIKREYGYKDILDEPNTEVRRAMVELYGAEKYLKDCGAICVQSDAVGKLWVAPADPLGRIRNGPPIPGFQRAISEAESRIVREASMWGDRSEVWGGRDGLPEISVDGRVRRNNAIVFVEVLNSTPEPDGSIKTYWLRVPPDTPTAKAGIAWTFGVTEGEYNPEVQT